MASGQQQAAVKGQVMKTPHIVGRTCKVAFLKRFACLVPKRDNLGLYMSKCAGYTRTGYANNAPLGLTSLLANAAI